jgi:hypothetical protein
MKTIIILLFASLAFSESTETPKPDLAKEVADARAQIDALKAIVAWDEKNAAELMAAYNACRGPRPAMPPAVKTVP